MQLWKLELESGWDNTKQAKAPCFHCGLSIKNCKLYRAC